MNLLQKYAFIALFLSFFALSPNQAIIDNYPALSPNLLKKLDDSCNPLGYSLYFQTYYGYIDIHNFIPVLSHILTHKKNIFISDLCSWGTVNFFQIILIDKLSSGTQEQKEQILNDFSILCNEHTDFFNAYIKRFSAHKDIFPILLQNKNTLELLIRELKNNNIPKKDFEILLITEFSRKKYTLDFFLESAKKELFKPIMHLIEEQKKLKAQFKNFVTNAQESISSHHLSIAEKSIRANIKKSCCFNQFIKALQKEKELTAQGYVCFYHGQMRDYAVMSDLGNILFNKLAGETAKNDFFFMQFRASDFDHIKQLIAAQKTLPAIITEIKKEHASMLADRTEGWRYPWRLSLNIFAFGNCYNSGSNTFNFVETNTNINSSKNIFKLTCDNFNIPATISIATETRMWELIRKYKELYATGRLILFALPAAKVDMYAYIAEVGAYRYKPYINNRYIETITELVNVLKKNTIHFNQLDQLEFATPLTPVGCLNPHKGIKLFVFENDHYDKQLEKELHKERDALVDDIIAELKKQHLLKGCQQIAKEFSKLLTACA